MLQKVLQSLALVTFGHIDNLITVVESFSPRGAILLEAGSTPLLFALHSDKQYLLYPFMTDLHLFVQLSEKCYDGIFTYNGLIHSTVYIRIYWSFYCTTNCCHFSMNVELIAHILS